MKLAGTWPVTSALAVGLMLGACGDDAPMAPLNPCEIDPREPGVETIDSVAFDASLGVELDEMTELPSGVYIRDLVDGTGDTIQDGSDVVLGYAGYLTNGCRFDAGQLGPYEHPNPGIIQGWSLGIDGQVEGSLRQLVIPWELGYGPSDYLVIPGGSVLVFEIEAVVVD